MTIKYDIQISSKAKKDIKRFDPKLQKKIINSIYTLQIDRYPRQFKPLVGGEIAAFRLRVGDYRILYDVYDDDGIVVIIRVGHRKDIYR